MSEGPEGIVVTRLEDLTLRPTPAPDGGTPSGLAEVSLKQVISDDAPYVQVSSTAGGAIIPPHRHSVAEVHVILSGSLMLGGASCPAGSVIVIPKDAEYGFEVGEDGVTWVTVRPSVSEVVFSNTDGRG